MGSRGVEWSGVGVWVWGLVWSGYGLSMGCGVVWSGVEWNMGVVEWSGVEWWVGV